MPNTTQSARKHSRNPIRVETLGQKVRGWHSAPQLIGGQFFQNSVHAPKNLAEHSIHALALGACVAATNSEAYRLTIRAIRAAFAPAPNPLSIFTTTTLLLQLFIIPSSAAIPPNDAP